jgi:transcriptional regulator with XRE-family HTH domain
MPWIRVGNFKKQLKDYRTRTGKTQVQAAEALETTFSTLKFWLSGNRSPHIESLQRAATLFGCSVTEFIDDPGKEIAGVDVAQLSEKRRFLAGLMFEGITADDLSDEDAQLLYEDYLAAKARLIAMKNRMRQSGGAT